VWGRNEKRAKFISTTDPIGGPDISVYDAMAPVFDQRHGLPDGVPEAIRAAVLGDCTQDRPRILDLGAGAGRIGWVFVEAGDDYLAADLSFGMLRAFAKRRSAARLVQADGARLPFPDAAFDAVLLVQVLSGAHGWQHLLKETLRVLRDGARLFVGRVIAPDDGVDARMKTRLGEILAEMNIYPYRDKPRDDAMAWLARAILDHDVVAAATWTAERTPAAFVERHGSGVRFSVLAEPVKQTAMRRLAAWAAREFGSCDTVSREQHRFELIIHRLQPGTTH
jgi:ubiquinone/menaquinone biosynthesis C-methylase UbiE